MKFIYGDAGDLSDWYDTTQTTIATGEIADYYLFNITNDREETTNLAFDSDYASYVTEMKAVLDSYVGNVYEFEGKGTCSDDEMIVDNIYYSGCCA